MSQLMQMRQRIQAIQTIKKITHAMRLISMSTHGRMKHQEKPLDAYLEKINALGAKTRALEETAHTDSTQLNKNQEQVLVILVGSQKGLCANFNTSLMQRFNTFTKQLTDFSLITVGKRATQLAGSRYREHMLAEYNTFSIHNMLSIAQELLNRITQAPKSYTSVYIVSNRSTSFFSQKPEVQKIIPNDNAKTDSSETADYRIVQTPQEIIAYVTRLYVLSHIQHALFQSLLAEHAARFISMDSSTRNAETLLEKMQLDYNKLRQANITRELTELSAFFLQ